MDILAGKIQSLYIFIISISGAIAFAFLVVGGFRYLISGGKPENVKAAKDQIFSAVLGLLIILSAWLILNTINPALLGSSIPVLPSVPQNPIYVQATQTYIPIFYPKVEEVVENITAYTPIIQKIATNINTLIQSCSCTLAESTCLCNGGEEGNKCQPGICYAKSPEEPCPYKNIAQDGGPGIKTSEQDMIAFQYQLLYYKNRLTLEITDINKDIDIIKQTISDYTQSLNNPSQTQAQKQYTSNQITSLNTEIGHKNNLITQITALIKSIDDITPHMLNIGTLPDQCELPANYATPAPNSSGNTSQNSTPAVGLKLCKPSCRPDITNLNDPSNSKYGCHDKLLGCQPNNCTGPNPCPVGAIGNELGQIQGQVQPLNTAADNVTGAIKQINNFKAIQIPK